MKKILIMILLAASLAPSVDAQSTPAPGADLVFEDPANDAFLGGMPSGTLPNVIPLSASEDILKVGVGAETENSLTFFLEVRDLNANEFLLFNERATFELTSQLDGSPAAYFARWWVPVGNALEPRTGIHEADGRFCLAEKQEENNFGGGGFWFHDCSDQRAKFTVDYDANRLQAVVTKSAMMGLEPLGSAPVKVHPIITQGSRLSGVQAMSGGQSLGNDYAPNEGPYPQPFIFAKQSANLQIRLRADPPVPVETVSYDNATYEVPTDEGAAVPDKWTVEPGVSTLIPLRLENTNTAKRIINLTAKLDQPDSKWQVQILPSIQVPGGDARVVNLIVNVTEGVPHRSPATVLVEGRSLGFAKELAAVSLDLVASVSPGPTANVLHFHAAKQESFGTTICPLGCFWGGQELWLNLLDTDEAGTADEGMGDNMQFWGSHGNYQARFELESPPTRDLVFDRTKPFELSLNFKTQVESEGELIVEVADAEGATIGSTSQSATFKTGTPVIATFLPEVDRVAANIGTLTIDLQIRVPTAGPGAAAQVTEFTFVPKGSTAKLPLAVDPLAKVTVAGGIGLVTLASSTDSENLINPGRTKLLNLTVVNEGLEADEAKIEVVMDSPWPTSIRPGSSFLLRPGESAKFSILVTAPADAKEGDRLNLVVNATSTKNPNALSQLRFVTVVVTGVDIADEGRDYRVDAESQDKVAGGDIRRSPGAGAAAVFSLAALALLRRRRQ